DTEERLADDAVRRDAGLAAEKAGKHQHAGEHHLADAERDQRERGAGAARGHVAEENSERHPGQPADQWKQGDRKGKGALADQIERMHRQVSAEPRVHRMAERKHAALAQQHVVAEREDDQRAHLDQHRQRESAAEHERRNDEHECQRAPDHPAPDVERRVLHPSRVPIRPVGRKMSSNTISRYGSTGATCDILIPPTRFQSSATANVCMQPISSDAMNAPASDPMPPTTTITKMIGPTDAAMPGSVTKALPPITPASPASAVPPPKTSMNTRGTLCPSASTVCGCVSAAWITRPIRVRGSASQIDTSIATDTSIMKTRYVGYWEVRIENIGPSRSGGTR